MMEGRLSIKFSAIIWLADSAPEILLGIPLLFSSLAQLNWKLGVPCSGLSPGFRYTGWKYAIFIVTAGKLVGKYIAPKSLIIVVLHIAISWELSHTEPIH